MLKQLFIIFFFALLVFSCSSEPSLQYPINYDSKDLFLEISKKNNRHLITLQEKEIEAYASSKGCYERTASGFWIKKIDLEEPKLLSSLSDSISFVYSVYNLSDSLLYSKEEIGVKNQALNKSYAFQGLTEALKNVSKGETSLIFPSALAYGFRGDGNKIGSSQPIRIELEILNIKKNEN